MQIKRHLGWLLPHRFYRVAQSATGSDVLQTNKLCRLQRCYSELDLPLASRIEKPEVGRIIGCFWRTLRFWKEKELKGPPFPFWDLTVENLKPFPVVLLQLKFKHVQMHRGTAKTNRNRSRSSVEPASTKVQSWSNAKPRCFPTFRGWILAEKKQGGSNLKNSPMAYLWHPRKAKSHKCLGWASGLLQRHSFSTFHFWVGLWFSQLVRLCQENLGNSDVWKDVAAILAAMVQTTTVWFAVNVPEIQLTCPI